MTLTDEERELVKTMALTLLDAIAEDPDPTPLALDVAHKAAKLLERMHNDKTTPLIVEC